MSCVGTCLLWYYMGNLGRQLCELNLLHKCLVLVGTCLSWCYMGNLCRQLCQLNLKQFCFYRSTGQLVVVERTIVGQSQFVKGWTEDQTHTQNCITTNLYLNKYLSKTFIIQYLWCNLQYITIHVYKVYILVMTGQFVQPQFEIFSS